MSPLAKLGWHTFGSGARDEAASPLEFWGVGEDGLPVFERVKDFG